MKQYPSWELERLAFKTASKFGVELHSWGIQVEDGVAYFVVHYRPDWTTKNWKLEEKKVKLSAMELATWF